MAANLGKVGYIADGGGLRGIHTVGFADVVWDYFQPQYMQGVSVGGLNAAAIALTLSIKTLIHIWINIVEQKGHNFLFRSSDFFLNYVKGKNSIYSNRGLLVLINQLDITKIAQSPIELEIVATNETNNNCLTFFSNRNAEHCRNFKKIICASTAVMGVFPPINIGLSTYSDGQHFDLNRALEKDCETIFVFSNNHICTRSSELPENMTAFRRMRKGINIASFRETSSHIENILLKNPDLMLWRHRYLPQQLDRLASKYNPEITKTNRRLIFLSPSKISPSLFMRSFKKGDLTQALHNDRLLAQEVIKTL